MLLSVCRILVTETIAIACLTQKKRRDCGDDQFSPNIYGALLRSKMIRRPGSVYTATLARDSDSNPNGIDMSTTTTTASKQAWRRTKGSAELTSFSSVYESRLARSCVALAADTSNDSRPTLSLACSPVTVPWEEDRRNKIRCMPSQVRVSSACTIEGHLETYKTETNYSSTGGKPSEHRKQNRSSEGGVRSRGRKTK